jgi:UDP-2,3-diacylglucosamine hydrolase
MGMIILQQPYLVEIGGKTFCIGHGDGLGPGHRWYKLMRWGFRARFFQSIFSLLHPWLAFRFGNGWSRHSRLARSLPYEFKGKDEPLYKWCVSFAKDHHVDYFIFGHYHCRVDMALPGGERLIVLKDWMKESPYLCFSGITGILGYSPKRDQ